MLSPMQTGFGVHKTKTFLEGYCYLYFRFLIFTYSLLFFVQHKLKRKYNRI